MNATMPTLDPAAAARAEAARLRAGFSLGFGRDFFVSGVLPWVAVLVLQHAGIGLVEEMAISTVFPVVDGLFTFVRKRRIDGVGSVNLAFIVGSIALALWSGDVHVALLKGALLTAVFGLVCVASLAAPKPLMYFLGRQFSTRGDAALIAQWDARWRFPRFRTIMRVITAAWGFGFLFEATVRTIAAYTLPPVVVFASAPFITYGAIAALAAWTIAYSSTMRRTYAAELAEAA